MRRAALFAFLLGAGLAGAQTPHTHQHSFDHAERWSQIFDDPARDAWQKPHEVIQALALPPEARVADLGAGTGYFSARLANMLPGGVVYAADIEPDMVRYLGERAKREGLKNLVPVASKPDDARLPEKVDLVLLVDVYHHIDRRSDYFRRLREALKPGGRIAIIDFRLDAPEGPPRSSRIPPEQVVTEMKAAGFVPAGAHEFLPRQYFLLFRAA
jgi:SAM-dependent methyltransferase